jgi:hypothetical protein
LVGSNEKEERRVIFQTEKKITAEKLATTIIPRNKALLAHNCDLN